MSGERPALRVGAVSYLNTLPLIGGLEHAPGVRLSLHPPSAIALGLARASLDVGLVPVIELARQPALVRVSDACIAASGPVQSVVLALRRAPHRVRTLSLDPESRTSQVLAQVVLARRYGVHPEARERGAQADWAADGADASLVIGDCALSPAMEAWPRLDLAAEWLALTGLPFVFAVWAARRGAVADADGLAETLARCRDEGLLRIGEIAARAARGRGVPEALLRVYLEKRIRYRLGASEAAGLARFLETARSVPGAA